MTEKKIPPVFSNTAGVPLPTALWLAEGNYSYNKNNGLSDDNTLPVISATELLKPVKELILRDRITPEFQEPVELISFLNSQLGTAVHNHLEQIWREHYKDLLRVLNTPQHVIDRIHMNPTPEFVEANKDKNYIYGYTEKRSFKEFNGFIISGEFDFAFNNHVYDLKTTGTFTYANNMNHDEYTKQLSIYRWLNPEIITDNEGSIIYIFKDWKRLKFTSKDANYPAEAIVEKQFPLLATTEIETFIKNKLNVLKKYFDSPEEEIPLCTPEELWLSPSVYKYYANPEKLTRSTRNFDNYGDALAFMNSDKYKGKGIIKEIVGTPKKCQYCSARPICQQTKQYTQ